MKAAYFRYPSYLSTTFPPLPQLLRQGVAAAVNAVADDLGDGKIERLYLFQPARGDQPLRHLIRQKTVPQPVGEVLRDLAAVVYLEAEGVPRREERPHELPRLPEGEIAHQILAGDQLFLAYPLFIGVDRGGCEQHQPVGRKAPAHKARLFERKIGERHVDDAVLQHL